MFLMAMMVSATAVGVTSISANAAELTEEQQTAMSESVAAIAANPQAIQVMSTIFDAEYYATTYPDVVAIVGNDAQALFAHYISFGIGEGRDASASFNLDAYVAANPDLVDAFASLGMEINAANYINHYAASGINEGRVSTVAGAVEKGISVPSLTNSEVVLAQPVAPTPKKKVWATGGGGGGSTPASDSASETSSDSNNSASDSDREAVRQMWSNMPDEVFNSLSDEDIQILLNNENAVIGSDNKVYASQEEFMAAVTASSSSSEDSYENSDSISDEIYVVSTGVGTQSGVVNMSDVNPVIYWRGLGITTDNQTSYDYLESVKRYDGTEIVDQVSNLTEYYTSESTQIGENEYVQDSYYVVTLKDGTTESSQDYKAAYIYAVTDINYTEYSDGTVESEVIEGTTRYFDANDNPVDYTPSSDSE